MTEINEGSNYEVAQRIGFGKEAAIQAERQAAQLRSAVSLEVRINEFKELLAEKKVSIDTLDALFCFVYI